MSDTTNWYECTKCGQSCDLKPPPGVWGHIRGAEQSKCCGAPVKVVSSKTP